MKIDGHYQPYLGDTDHKRAVCAVALEMVAALDAGRIDTQGGYPSRVAFIGRDLIAIASVDHDNAPDLTVCRIDEFITKHDWLEEA